MRYSTAILHKLNPDWGDLSIRVVTFPAPPIPAKGVLYAEDAWASNTVEHALELFQAKEYRALSASMTNWGPAVVLQQRLAELMVEATTKELVDYVIPVPMYCATMSYEVLGSGHHTYANNTILEGIQPIHQSCHPGSHTCLPGAPFLTLWLQLERTRDNDNLPAGFQFADHQAGAGLFPQIDFSMNMAADKLFSYMTLADCMINGADARVLRPVISPALQQLAISNLASHSRLAAGMDVSRLIQRIDAYHSHIGA